MKPHLDISHRGTLGGDDRVRMTFDENSIAHLMNILTDLYSDPELAVIREYSTNAADSHARAGINKPIEVELPNELNPLFIVKDYGIGMSAADIYDYFSKYGWSSKRDTDSEAGMLGLGCKAALTYTSQFTLVTVKDGIQNVVLVTREEDGTGAVQIVHTDEADGPDGVEVRVPVKNVRQFNKRADWFYKFWSQGSVLVNGTEPTFYRDEPDTLLLDEDVCIISHDDNFEHDYIVMGNVPYPTGKERLLKLSGYYRTRFAIVRVEIGQVDFTPSREQLQFTKRTNAVIETAQEFITDRLMNVTQDYVEAATEPADAILRAKQWADCFNAHWNAKFTPFTWRGLKVPREFHVQQPIMEWRPYSYDDTREQASTLKSSISMETAKTAFHVVGHPGKNMTAQAKMRVLKHMEANDIQPKRILFYRNAEEFSPWWNEVESVRWSDLSPVKQPKGEPNPLAPRKLNWNGSSTIIEDDAIVDAESVWIGASEFTAHRREWCERVRKVTDRTVIVVLKEQQEKFQEAHPTIPHLVDFLNIMVGEFYDGLTEYEQWTLYESNAWDNAMSGFKELVGKEVLDSELEAFLATIQSTRNPATELGKFRAIGEHVEGLNFRTIPTDKEIKNTLDRMSDRYPLVRHFGRVNSGRNLMPKYVNDTYLASFVGKGPDR